MAISLGNLSTILAPGLKKVFAKPHVNWREIFSPWWHGTGWFEQYRDELYHQASKRHGVNLSGWDNHDLVDEEQYVARYGSDASVVIMLGPRRYVERWRYELDPDGLALWSASHP